MDYLWNKRDCKWLPSAFMLVSLSCVCLLSLQGDLHYVTQGAWLPKGPAQSFQRCHLQVASALGEREVKRDEIHKNQKPIILPRVSGEPSSVGTPVLTQ